MNAEVFGKTPDGTAVHRVRISGGGLTAHLLTWGAVVQDLRLDGHSPALVLGFDDFAHYPAHSPYFGATAGRCANRIGGASFELDGETCRTDPNFLGRHTLHGGSVAIGKRVWEITAATEDSVTLGIVSPDGEMGFPGTLDIEARFAVLEGGVLDIHYTARTDRATLCNLAHHSYFVLDDSGSILDHRLTLDAASWLPTDDELIPTGEVRPVDGTSWDFRAGRSLRQALEGGPLDTNFNLSDRRADLRAVGTLESPASGVAMEIRTTEPGLQVYDAARLDVPVPGLDGQAMGAHAGIALEPQVWPDAIHHPAWPQAVLRPGETYAQHTQFVFRRAPE